MKVHVAGEMAVTSFNRERYLSVLRKIQQWLYSFMKPGYVEDEDEYKISKYILLQFICSSAVFSAVDGKLWIVVGILRFLQFHVFVHENLYLHFRRRSLRHYDTSHATAHEVSHKYPLFEYS